MNLKFLLIFLKIRQRHLVIFFLNDINSETINKKNKYLKSTLEIPIIYSGNSEVSNKVNKKIRDDIMNFYEKSLKGILNSYTKSF